MTSPCGFLAQTLRSEARIYRATLAATGASYAQSNVELFGILDAAYTHVTGNGVSADKMTTSSNASSQLGFRGIEDIGSGIKGGFWLEAGLNNDSGAGAATNTNNQVSGKAPAAAGGQGLTFNRRSTVSVGGSFGELRMGRDYTPQFWNLTAYDPFGTNGVGTNAMMAGAFGSNVGTGGTKVRASNSFTYLYNHGFNATAVAGQNGFHAMAQYFLGENSSNIALPAGKNDGNGYGIRVGYNAGPLTIAVANGKTTLVNGTLNEEVTNVGGSYDLGVAKLMAQYSEDKYGTSKFNGYLLAATVPAGPGFIRASYSDYKAKTDSVGEVGKFAVGYVYNLSTRTALYGTYATVSNKNGSKVGIDFTVTPAAVNGSGSGFDLGIKHSF